MAGSRILVLDEGARLPLMLRNVLPEKGGPLLKRVDSVEAALTESRTFRPEIIFIGMRSAAASCLEALKRLKNTGIAAPIVVVASNGSVEAAIHAMRLGAHDFLVEPLNERLVEALLKRLPPPSGAAEREDAAEPAAVPRADGSGDEDRLVGVSRAILEVGKVVGRVAPTEATVLISGETGTGKELLARMIHRISPRSGRRFQAINCAAIPDNLLESELFGFEKGAFTSAASRRVGKVERASGGTLFLDEIGDMSLAHQSKILRVLEERSIQRLGARERVPVDLRVVAASQRDLWDDVEKGSFRSDLYYRLAVVDIRVPPLRERKEDIRPLTDYFVSRLERCSGVAIRRIERGVYERLRRYHWPGNVRELRNVLERSVVLGGGPLLTVHELPVLDGTPEERPDLRSLLRRFTRERISLERLERHYIHSALEEMDWHYGRTGELLKIHRNTLRRKVRRFGLQPRTS